MSVVSIAIIASIAVPLSLCALLLIAFSAVRARTDPSIEFDRQKKIVLIIGAARGVGRATADLFIENEFTVHIADIDYENLVESFAESSTASGKTLDSKVLPSNVVAHELDVNNHKHIEKMMAHIFSVLQRDDNQLYAVVMAANADLLSPAVETVDEAISNIMAVNFFSCHRLFKILYPLLKRDKSRVIFVSSMASCFNVAYNSAYAASKAAVEAYASSLRKESSGDGVIVSVVQTGLVESLSLVQKAKDHELLLPSSPFVWGVAGQAEALIHSFRAVHQTPEEVAEMVYWAATRYHARGYYSTLPLWVKLFGILPRELQDFVFGYILANGIKTVQFNSQSSLTES